VVDIINHRDKDGKVIMHLETDLAVAKRMPGGDAFCQNLAKSVLYDEPLYKGFVLFAQLLLDAGLNEFGSANALSILQQETTSGDGGHFRAWVRDRVPPNEVEGLDAMGVVEMVSLSRSSTYTHVRTCLRTYTRGVHLSIPYSHAHLLAPTSHNLVQVLRQKTIMDAKPADAIFIATGYKNFQALQPGSESHRPIAIDGETSEALDREIVAEVVAG
jgi:hypothetical protein